MYVGLRARHFLSCHHWSGDWEYCIIRVRSSAIHQGSAMVYVIFSLAMKWHKKVFRAKVFNGKQKKGVAMKQF